MSSGFPRDPVALAHPPGFDQRIGSYAQQLSVLLRENPWAFWKKSWWTYAHWARRDSELQKVLARTYGLLHEVLRWHSLD
ncbi:MAG TPA: hypothetical protein VFJ02_08550, partial [Vicinamibacterales bacterium]|nr:hypothetical protein [Vicinamibacterales bacterium]